MAVSLINLIIATTRGCSFIFIISIRKLRLQQPRSRDFSLVNLEGEINKGKALGAKMELQQNTNIT